MMVTIPLKVDPKTNIVYVETLITNHTAKMILNFNSAYSMLSTETAGNIIMANQRESDTVANGWVDGLTAFGNTDVRENYSLDSQFKEGFQGTLSTEFFRKLASKWKVTDDEFRLIMDFKNQSFTFDCRPWRQQLTYTREDTVFRTRTFSKKDYHYVRLDLGNNNWASITLQPGAEIMLDEKYALTLNRTDLKPNVYMFDLDDTNTKPVSIIGLQGSIKGMGKISPWLNNDSLLGYGLIKGKVVIFDTRDKLLVIRN